jgi:hypothetical protein
LHQTDAFHRAFEYAYTFALRRPNYNMRTFFQFLAIFACWLSSYGVMAHEANGIVGKKDAGLSLPVLVKAAAQAEISVADVEEMPRTFHVFVRGEHADNEAHLRSRQLQWRSMRLEACEALLSARKFCLLQVHFNDFSFNPWIDYTDPHLLYSYRLFLF